MRFFAPLLMAMPAVLGDVAIPWTNCGKAGDVLTVYNVTANVWPPKKGSSFDVTFNGALSTSINGGNYAVKASFDSIPVINKSGSLSDLNVTFPIQSGPISIQKGLTFPTSIPSGTYDVTASATDSTGVEIACASIKLSLSTLDGSDDSDSDIDINDNTHITTQLDTETNTIPVPWTNCGKSSDLLTVYNATANVWPPKKGAEFDVTFNGALLKDITGGNYALKASFDGIPVLSKNGALSDLNVSFPIKSGPISITKGMSFPTSVPSGTYDVSVSATDSTGAEIACASLKVSLSSTAPELVVVPFPLPTVVDILPTSTENDTPVPWTNCGKTGDLLTVYNATANVWPPKKGAEFDVTFNGALSKDITGGNYALKASFDGIPVLSKNGALSDLNVTFPIKSGPISIQKGMSFPTSVPSGTYDVSVSATDSTGAEIACASLKVSLSSSAPSSPVTMINYLPGLANTPVSFTNCGSSTDQVTINSLSADVWPPKKGQDVTIFFDATAKTTVSDGSYDAAVTWDGIKIDDEKGSLASLGVTLPVAGEFVAKKTLAVPSIAPSGAISIKATALDTANNQLFCVLINTSI